MLPCSRWWDIQKSLSPLPFLYRLSFLLLFSSLLVSLLFTLTLRALPKKPCNWAESRIYRRPSPGIHPRGLVPKQGEVISPTRKILPASLLRLEGPRRKVSAGEIDVVFLAVPSHSWLCIRIFWGSHRQECSSSDSILISLVWCGARTAGGRRAMLRFHILKLLRRHQCEAKGGGQCYKQMQKAQSEP